MTGRTAVIAGLVAAALAAGAWLLFAGGGDGRVEVEPVSDEAAADAAMGAGFAVHAATAATAETATYRIRGSVVDAAGTPVAGVRVTTRRSGAVYDMNDPKTWGDWGTAAAFERTNKEIDAPTVEEEKPTAQATSAEDGTFLLEVREAGNYEVAARPEPPRVGTRATAPVTPAKPEGKARLSVLDGSRFVGRVLDAGEQGVAGVVVKSSWQTKSGGNDSWTSMPATRTDGSGGFALEAVPAGKGSISVTVPGRMTLSGVEVTTPYTGTFVIRLTGGGVLRGRVTDLRGEPIGGADVAATIKGFAKPDAHEPTACQPRAKTEPDGTWRMDGVLPGTVTSMTAGAQGYTLLQQTAPRATWAGAEVKAGTEAVIDLVLKKGGAVAGRVSESGTGAPIPDVELRLMRGESTGSNQTPTTTTGADGRFRFDDVPLGKHVLLPQSATHWSAEVESATTTANVAYAADAVRSAPSALTVVLTTEGETAERDLVMRPGLAVRGRVVGPDGAGVEGAKIRSSTASNLQWQWGLNYYGGDFGVLGTSGADGAFELKGLPPRENWVLTAAKESLLGLPCKPFKLAADAPPPAALVIEMAQGASLAGRALDADGKGAAGWNLWYWSMEATSGNQTASGTTEADGSFLLKGLVAGRGQLQVSGGGGTASKQIDPPLTAGEARKDVEIRLEKTAELSGVVVDPEGNPVSGLSLNAQGENGGGWSGSASTGGDGTFTIKARVNGRTRIHVSEATDQGSWSSVPLGEAVQAPASGLRLVYTAKKRTTITGRVLDPAGKPVPLCNVASASTNRNYGWVNPDEVAGGEFVRAVEGSPPFTLTVSAPRDSRGRPLNLKSKQVTVTDAKEPVVVTLEAGIELTGQVLGPDGKGVVGVTIRSGTVSAPTDEDGRFRVAGLPGDAEIDVSVQAPPKYAQVKPFKAKPGDKEVVVRLNLGISISGRVVGPDGKPVSNGGINATWTTPSGGNGQTWANTGEGGAFRVEGLVEDAVATLDVNVWSPDGITHLRPVKVTGVRAGTSDLVIRMESGVSIEGRVVTPDGAPATFSYVLAVRVGAKGEAEGGGQTLYGQAAGEGSFTIGGLEAGATYSLRVQGQGVPGVESARVAAPATNVRLTVTPPIRVTGRLDGMMPGVDYWVQGWPAADGPEGVGHTSGKVAADGTFTLQMQGDREVCIAAGAPAADDRYALLGPLRPGSAEVVLRFQPGLSIEGRVEGLPAGVATVGVKSDRWRTSVKVDADGRFKVRGLPEGHYALSIYTNGGTTSADTADAGATGLVLKAQR